MADVVTKTDKGYLVDPYVTFKYYEDNEESAPSGKVELVQEIFETPPTELIEAECQRIYDRMAIISAEKDKLEKEAGILRSEVSTLQKTKTDLGKLIINRSEIKNAKRIILFEKDKIPPFIMEEGKKITKINLSYQISQWENQERAWSYELGWGDSWSSGQYFDEDYNLMFDLTDEEILRIAKERQIKKVFPDWAIKSTPDQWLTEEMLKKKQCIKANERLAEIDRWNKEIVKANENLAKLNGQVKEPVLN